MHGFKRLEKGLPMSSSEIAIKVNNVSKHYQIYDSPRDRLKQFIFPKIARARRKVSRQYFREFRALQDISFEIRKGETVGIIGRNGSGKSTLLQIICGTLSPTEGSVATYGRIAALLELGSGFNPEFTGRENVYMNGSVLGLSNEEIDNRFDDISAFADIGQFIDQPVKTYSSGMFVRLAFAVNIMSEPDIMIVDEALAVGDMNFQAKCITSLTRIQERGATVLFVSHDIGTLKSLCSRGIYLEHGKVEAIGAAGEIADLYVRKMREEMNEGSAKPAVNVVSKSDDPLAPPLDSLKSATTTFKTSAEFTKRVEQLRYGSGGVKFTFAELLDAELRPIQYAEFDQTIYVKLYLEAEIGALISTNYYILDEKRNVIVGSGLRQAGHEAIQVGTGDRYVVTFQTRLPLHEGNYSVQLEITQPIIADNTAEFLDVIDNAIVFRVGRRPNGRIWSRVFIANTVDISRA